MKKKYNTPQTVLSRLVANHVLLISGGGAKGNVEDTLIEGMAGE